MVPVHCISRSQEIKIDFLTDNFSKIFQKLFEIVDYLIIFFKYFILFFSSYGPLHDNTTHQSVPVSRQDNSRDKTAHQLAPVFNNGTNQIVRAMSISNFDILYGQKFSWGHSVLQTHF